MVWSAWWLLAAACSREPPPPPAGNVTPRDAQHQGITTPHGDHSAHHGGMVLMNGELHYEVVFDRARRPPRLVHRRGPAGSSGVDGTRRPDDRRRVPTNRPRRLALEIDDAGESWVAKGRPVEGENVMVKVSYAVQGVPHEVEIPFLIPVK